MKHQCWIGILLAMACMQCAFAATDYFVSKDGASSSPFNSWGAAATNIQDVIDLARDGDTIFIADGTFTVTGEIAVSYAVTIRSASGPEQTVLTGSYPSHTNRCFNLKNHGMWLDGLTISNFHATGYGGGGVYLGAGNLTNCVITRNHTIGANTFGGGLFTAPTWTGLVTHCKVSYNVNPSQFGGGVGMRGNGMLRCCEIYGNTGRNGGGVWLNKGIVDRCVIRDNISSGNPGGGVSGSHNSGPDVILRNSLIMRNVADVFYGGGVAKNSNSFSIVNCTIVSNYATYTGGLYLMSDTHPDRQVLFNCIIADNRGSGGVPDLYMEHPAQQTNWFFNCCVGSYLLDEAQGNISANPLFVNTDPATPNYRLRSDSPCVNAGTNQLWMLNAVDLDGRRRIDGFDQQVDMGAYEYQPSGTLIEIR